MPQPTLEAALFNDLDGFLKQVEVMQGALLSMRTAINLRWLKNVAELERAGVGDPFRPGLQTTGRLALSFLMPPGYCIEFSGKTNPARAVVHKEIADGLLIPTGSTIDLLEANPMRSSLVRAILDEDRLSVEADQAMRRGERKRESPIRTEVVGEIVNGECLVAELGALTETNRSSYYNLQIVPIEKTD